jgi:hypothetical protein
MNLQGPSPAMSLEASFVMTALRFPLPPASQRESGIVK